MPSLRRFRLPLLLLTCALAAPALAQTPIVVNEIMAANHSTLADPQGHYDDWIELHNTGPNPVDLGGMYLTDDPDNPTQWQIPAGTIVAARGYTLIWTDNDTTDPGLHAAFRLDSTGDRIALFESDGATLIDRVNFGAQRSDIAYGRRTDRPDEWAFMLTPTPGAENSSAYDGKVADTKFTHDRGFYDAPFEVTITCNTPGATIYYTLDGTDPYSDARQVPSGDVYTAPILIFDTTCLRAQAIKTGWLPSNADTHTYIFADQAATRSQRSATNRGYPATWFQNYPADYEMDAEIYEDPDYAPLMADALRAIPTLSLVTDKDYFFSKDNNPLTGGIYVYTGHSSTGGQDWERPVSAEMFTADGAETFHVNCGVRIQGGEGRRPDKCPKHSFSLRFRSRYGPSTLDRELFDGSPVASFDTVQLRGFFNNAWTHWAPDQRQRTQYIRDQWMRDALLDMGQIDAGQGFYVNLYINGIYWGLYNLQERPVAAHYAAYHGGDPDRIDAINGGRATDGTTTAWNEAKSIAASRDWTRITEVIDIDNFIDFTLLNFFAGNTDLKTNGNWRAAGGGPDRRPWRFYSWDAEHVMESTNQSGTRPSDDPTGMYRSLRDIDEFRIRFADRVHKHLFNDGALTAARNAERWRRRSDEIELAVVAESARWGDYRRDMHSYQSGPYYLYTRNDYWIPEKNELLDNYFPRRTDVALQQFRSMGFYPNVQAPAFHLNGTYQHGGHAAADAALTMPAPAGQVWYTLDGTDPRTPSAGPTGGEQWVIVPEDAPKKVLVPTAAISDAWRTDPDFDDAAWLSGTGGVGYERSTGYEQFFNIDVQAAMYGRSTTCYIRIPFETTIEDLTEAGGLTLKVRFDDGFIAYLNGAEVQRVMFSGTPAWNSGASGTHSDIDAIAFETFNISAHVDKLRLGDNILAIHGLNAGVTSSDFLISAELASTKGATGGTPSGVAPTALRYDSAVTLDHSARVKARALNGATWSALNEATFAVGPVAESLRISEIMYHPSNDGLPGDPNTEYVELTNIGAETINLNLVAFTNGIDFAFGDTELAPGDYVLLVRDLAAFQARYGDELPVVGQYAGSFSNAGERIELLDAIGQTIHNFRFRDNWYDLTDGQGFSLTVKDPAANVTLDDKSAWRPSAEPDGSPGFDDTGAIPELGAVVINELLANPDAGQSDWIELHNTTNQTINIGGWFLSDDADDLAKYEIAPGTAITAGGYLVFYAADTFANDTDPGAHTPFALSSNGETLYLHSGADGLVTGYSISEKFDASEAGTSLGRHHKSTGAVNFVALTEPTPGAANAQPLVGPIVINEIMYNPGQAADAEYVELLNISSAPVTLYDELLNAPWRFTDNPDDPGIELFFPADPAITLAPGAYLVLTRDALAFDAAYNVPDGVPVLAWGAGKLANGREKIQLSKPAGTVADDDPQWIRIDRVVYSDGSNPQDFAAGLDPWPLAADGQGQSLSRINPQTYANDPANWQPQTPTPGAPNP